MLRALFIIFSSQTAAKSLDMWEYTEPTEQHKNESRKCHFVLSTDLTVLVNLPSVHVIISSVIINNNLYI